MRKVNHARFIVFDVETPNRYNDRISAIGITVVENGAVTDRFFSYVNPQTFFDSFNTKLTGISESKVALRTTNYSSEGLCEECNLISLLRVFVLIIVNIKYNYINSIQQ